MALRVVPEAQAEADAARTWLDGERPGLGDEFNAELEPLLRRIARMPQSFAAHRIQGIRKGFLKRFPFTVYFPRRPTKSLSWR